MPHESVAEKVEHPLILLAAGRWSLVAGRWSLVALIVRARFGVMTAAMMAISEKTPIISIIVNAALDARFGEEEEEFMQG